ncbi:hypothetical protein M378DRAFT_530907 [Amanita muscaria Koide BX008]|uniref:Uncharacterized protein n=1 Tax=Amanita muscaria (strain Koide BX008) TaxID=946122 RepID=A0A0C2X9R9_AMAMK|nr:hypothetical protein M378DRAFT_530907 [Amanita muscaria Koide BX008]
MMYVYPDEGFGKTLDLMDFTEIYVLTGSIFAMLKSGLDRQALLTFAQTLAALSTSTSYEVIPPVPTPAPALPVRKHQRS